MKPENLIAFGAAFFCALIFVELAFTTVVFNTNNKNNTIKLKINLFIFFIYIIHSFLLNTNYFHLFLFIQILSKTI